MAIAPASTDPRPGTGAAADVLFERHRQRIYAYCLSRTRNPADAEDALQTTFMYALRALQRGVVPRLELPWLLRIAENVCHSMRRRAYRRHEGEELPADIAGDRSADQSAATEQIGKLCAAVETLTEKQRTAILLREWRGLSYEDIAAELEISHSAVETLLFRARRSIVERIGSVAGAGLNLPLVPRLVRWLFAPGAAKATAVAVVGVAVIAAAPPAGPSPVAPSPLSPTAVVRPDRSPVPPAKAPQRAAETSPAVWVFQPRPSTDDVVAVDPPPAEQHPAGEHPAPAREQSAPAAAAPDAAAPPEPETPGLVSDTVDAVEALVEPLTPVTVPDVVELVPPVPSEIVPPTVDLPLELPLELP